MRRLPAPNAERLSSVVGEKVDELLRALLDGVEAVGRRVDMERQEAAARLERRRRGRGTPYAMPSYPATQRCT